MATQYLIFASSSAADNASQADWAQRVLGHPTDSNAVTRRYWGFISNSAGTIGLISDNIIITNLTSSEQAALVPASNPTVIAVLAAQPQTP